MGTGSFPVVKNSRGVLLTTHPLLVPWSRRSRAKPLPTLWATPGLYRTSVPEKGAPLPSTLKTVKSVYCYKQYDYIALFKLI